MIRLSLLICVVLIASRALAQSPRHSAGFDEDKVTDTEDTQCLRTVRTEGNKTWTNFYEFRTIPVPRVQFRQFPGNVSFEDLKDIDAGKDKGEGEGEGHPTPPEFPTPPESTEGEEGDEGEELLQEGEDGEEEEGEETEGEDKDKQTPINFRMEYEKLIEFLDNDGVPGFDENSNDTIVQMKILYNPRDRPNFESPWDRIEADFSDFDGSNVYTVKSSFEGFELEMFSGDKEYRVNGTDGKPSNITFSPDEVHMSLKMPLDLFDAPLRNDSKIALCARIVRKKGKATFTPGGKCSRGPKGKSPRNPKCMKPCPPEETSAPETTEATTVPETTTEATTVPETTTTLATEPPIGETPAPPALILLTGDGEDKDKDGKDKNGDKDKGEPKDKGEEKECYEGGEGEHEKEEPFDKEWNFNFTETETSKQKEGGGRKHKDIEFQPDEEDPESPSVYVSWDPKITCIRKDKTTEEVDVVATLVDLEGSEDPFEGRMGGNPFGGDLSEFLDPAHEEDEIVTTAYFTFDRDLLGDVESFFWDPEIGVDFLQDDDVEDGEGEDSGLEGEDGGEGEGEEGEGEGESEGEVEESPEDESGLSAASNTRPAAFGVFVAAASLAVSS